MKKIIASGLLILAFAATSYAQAPKLDFVASGFIDAITEYWRTAPSNSSGGIYDVVSSVYKPNGIAFDRKNAYMESRFRLKFDAKMGKELSGTIFFEGDSSRWGDLPGGTSSKISERNTYGYWSGDRAAVEIKNVYFDAALPYMGIPVPIQLRVGLQPLAVRTNLFLYTDGMGVKPSIKIDPVNIELYWFKALEGKDWTADDVDVYGVQLSGKVDTYTLGGYWFYYNMNSYPFNHANVPVNGLDTPYEAAIWWAGVYLDGKAGPVNVNFDFIYDYGKVKARDTYLIAPDVKYRGWVGYLKVDYPYDMFNFGGVVTYATGADKRDTSSSGLPGSLTASGVPSDKVTSFVQPPGS